MRKPNLTPAISQIEDASSWFGSVGSIAQRRW